jgi:integrase/recombinase XerD
MKTTYKLYSGIRTDKKRADGSFPVYFFLRVGGSTVKIPTGKHVMDNEWNKKDNTAKSNSQKGIALSSFLNKRITDFNTFMLTEEAMGKEVTLNLALQFFKGNDRVDFYQFWDCQIKMWEGEKRYNTLKSYLTAYRILKTIAPNLSFADINYAFLEKFDHHLINVRKNSIGGRFTKHKVLRCMINHAIVKGYMKENPYKHFKFKPAKGNRMFLTIQEVEKIINCKLPSDGKNLSHAQNMFIFGCLTGIRFSDIIRLKFKNILAVPARIELVMNKTSKPITIPLLPIAESIINKYRNLCIASDEKNVFPNIANATINKKLKDLMKLANINKSISFHCSRHTFATTHIHAKTSLSHLQQLLGHASVLETTIYAKTLKEDLYTSMDNLNSMYQHPEAI